MAPVQLRQGCFQQVILATILKHLKEPEGPPLSPPEHELQKQLPKTFTEIYRCSCRLGNGCEQLHCLSQKGHLKTSEDSRWQERG